MLASLGVGKQPLEETAPGRASRHQRPHPSLPRLGSWLVAPSGHFFYGLIQQQDRVG